MRRDGDVQDSMSLVKIIRTNNGRQVWSACSCWRTARTGALGA
jgi:hypothetical protein